MVGWWLIRSRIQLSGGRRHMPQSFRQLFLICAGLLSTVGCRGSVHHLVTPESLTLLSIDGLRDPEPEASGDERMFHGYPVLGRLEIKDPAELKVIVDALISATQDATSTHVAGCFWPRHGIRAIENGKTFEFIICFECSGFSEYINGKPVRGGPVTKNVQATFDEHLVAAGIPLAPKTQMRVEESP
jgi:hypothetical protein